MRTRDLERWINLKGIKGDDRRSRVYDKLKFSYELLTESEEDCAWICPATYDFLGEPCDMCACFKELRGKAVVPEHGGIKRKCPCYVFGREDATKRLKKLLDRLEKDGWT